jgi:hypothetical protein
LSPTRRSGEDSLGNQSGNDASLHISGRCDSYDRHGRRHMPLRVPRG